MASTSLFQTEHVIKLKFIGRSSLLVFERLIFVFLCGRQREEVLQGKLCVWGFSCSISQQNQVLMLYLLFSHSSSMTESEKCTALFSQSLFCSDAVICNEKTDETSPGRCSLLQDLSIPLLWSLTICAVFLWCARCNWRPFWEVSNWKQFERFVKLFFFFAVLYIAEVDVLLFIQGIVASMRNQTHLGV